jgi:hypothetical protein
MLKERNDNFKRKIIYLPRCFVLTCNTHSLQILEGIVQWHKGRQTAAKRVQLFSCQTCERRSKKRRNNRKCGITQSATRNETLPGFHHVIKGTCKHSILCRYCYCKLARAHLSMRQVLLLLVNLYVNSPDTIPVAYGGIKSVPAILIISTGLIRHLDSQVNLTT